jgi:hypothetical protein
MRKAATRCRPRVHRRHPLDVEVGQHRRHRVAGQPRVGGELGAAGAAARHQRAPHLALAVVQHAQQLRAAAVVHGHQQQLVPLQHGLDGLHVVLLDVAHQEERLGRALVAQVAQEELGDDLVRAGVVQHAHLAEVQDAERDLGLALHLGDLALHARADGAPRGARHQVAEERRHRSPCRVRQVDGERSDSAPVQHVVRPRRPRSPSRTPSCRPRRAGAPRPSPRSPCRRRCARR